jgi:hypothetical protein
MTGPPTIARLSRADLVRAEAAAAPGPRGALLGDATALEALARAVLSRWRPGDRLVALGNMLGPNGDPARTLDGLLLLRRRSMQPLRPRAAILQAGQAFPLIALDPLTNRARANACGFTDGLRRLPTQNHFDQALSTKRRQAGILVDVHSALPRTS